MDKLKPTADKEVDIVLAEYSTLRTELLQRISTRYQIVSLALAALTAVLGAGSFTAKGIYFVLIYPIISFALMNVYISNANKIDRIKDYIKLHLEDYVRDDIEPALDDKVFQWQHTDKMEDDKKGNDKAKNENKRQNTRGKNGVTIKGSIEGSIKGRLIFPVTSFAALIPPLVIVLTNASDINVVATWILIGIAFAVSVYSVVIGLRPSGTPLFNIT